MEITGLMDLFIVSVLMAIAFVLYYIVLHKRKVGGNPELWGTVFEALSHYIQPLGVLKDPKMSINKQKHNDGEGRGTGIN